MPSDQKLSDVLSDFARTMVTDFSIQSILDQLVGRIVDILPVTSAGVTLISPGVSPRFVAASDDSALLFEGIQTEFNDGPSAVAFQTGFVVAAPNLDKDPRFPKFTPRALDGGLEAVFALPLRSGSKRLGALDLYRDHPGHLTKSDLATARTLADVVAAYLHNAQARSELTAFADRAQEAAIRDPLSGLANRGLLIENIDHALLRTKRSGSTAAVFFIDVDRFNQVNETYGLEVGDQLLIALSHRLRELFRSSDTLARLSGDEFVVLCEDLDAPAEADTIALRIASVADEPFLLGDAEINVTLSIGIGLSRLANPSSEQILREANAAMHQAKRQGGARFQIVDQRQQRLVGQLATLEHDLHGASERGELVPHYQPIVETGAGRVIGAEALLRWTHPTRGILPPVTVVPLAERSGLICKIGQRILEHACVDRHVWQSSSLATELTVSVNVSTTQIISHGFVEAVEAVLSRTSTDPSLVTLEVTESVFVQDSDRATAVLRDLKQLGVRLALDDFGTGYSSLNYLKRFPIDIVKIDRGFISDLEHDRASHAIVSAVVNLAHLLEMTVVAEGIETPEQHQRLLSLGCDYCQGYYFSRPMAGKAFDLLVQDLLSDGSVSLPAPARPVTSAMTAS